MVGVMPVYPPARHADTSPRTWLMKSFSCTRSEVQDSWRVSCLPRFFGGGIGMKNEETLRDSAISLVIPSSPKT